MFYSSKLKCVPESNWTERSQATILYNEFEKYTFKITGKSPRVQWVLAAQ